MTKGGKKYQKKLLKFEITTNHNGDISFDNQKRGIKKTTKYQTLVGYFP